MKLSDKQAKALTTQNQANLKQVSSGKSINYIQAKRVVLIGARHDKTVENAVKKDQTNSGTIKVTRDMIGKGSVEISGCTNRSEMEDAIKAISDKAIKFV
jgi:hypothetical protein